MKVIQELYIKALCKETKMTQRQFRSLLKKKINIYLTAEEAVKYGIADVIVQEIIMARVRGLQAKLLKNTYEAALKEKDYAFFDKG